MKKAPYVKDYFDDDEKNLIESMEAAINANNFTPASRLTYDRDRLTKLHTTHEEVLNNDKMPNDFIIIGDTHRKSICISA